MRMRSVFFCYHLLFSVEFFLTNNTPRSIYYGWERLPVTSFPPSIWRAPLKSSSDLLKHPRRSQEPYKANKTPHIRIFWQLEETAIQWFFTPSWSFLRLARSPCNALLLTGNSVWCFWKLWCNCYCSHKILKGSFTRCVYFVCDCNLFTCDFMKWNGLYVVFTWWDLLYMWCISVFDVVHEWAPYPFCAIAMCDPIMYT